MRSIPSGVMSSAFEFRLSASRVIYAFLFPAHRIPLQSPRSISNIMSQVPTASKNFTTESGQSEHGINYKKEYRQ